LFCHTVTKARAISNPRRMRTRNWLAMGTWQEMRLRRRSCSKNRRAVSALYCSPGSVFFIIYIYICICSHSCCGDRLSATRLQETWINWSVILDKAQLYVHC
jgi:hypothetical protein